MPRGTSKPAETVISELQSKKAGYQSKIENYKTKITEIDTKIRSMSDHQRQKEIDRILDAIKDTGRSVDDFITSFLENAKAAGPGS